MSTIQMAETDNITIYSEIGIFGYEEDYAIMAGGYSCHFGKIYVDI